MSDLHVSLVQQEMEENGELDFIRAHVAAANEAVAGGTPTPAAQQPVETVEEDVVEEDEDVQESGQDAEEETPAAEVSADQDDVLWLDIDDATQQLIDTKYGGDLGKALSALRESQSVIGRQGNEMGALRAELAAAMEQLRGDLISAQPYAD